MMNFNPIFVPENNVADFSKARLSNTSYLFSDIIKVFIDKNDSLPVQASGMNTGTLTLPSIEKPEIPDAGSEDLTNNIFPELNSGIELKNILTSPIISPEEEILTDKKEVISDEAEFETFISSLLNEILQKGFQPVAEGNNQEPVNAEDLKKFISGKIEQGNKVDINFISGKKQITLKFSSVDAGIAAKEIKELIPGNSTVKLEIEKQSIQENIITGEIEQKDNSADEISFIKETLGKSSIQNKETKLNAEELDPEPISKEQEFKEVNRDSKQISKEESKAAYIKEKINLSTEPLLKENKSFQVPLSKETKSFSSFHERSRGKNIDQSLEAGNIEKAAAKELPKRESKKITNSEETKIEFKKADDVNIIKEDIKEAFDKPGQKENKFNSFIKENLKEELNSPANKIIIKVEPRQEEKNIKVPMAQDNKKEVISPSNADNNQQENISEKENPVKQTEAKETSSKDFKEVLQHESKTESKPDVHSTERKAGDQAEQKINHQVEHKANTLNKPAGIEELTIPKEKAAVLKSIENWKTIKSSSLVKEFTNIVQQGESKIVVLKLVPEHLGNVKIELDFTENNLKADVEVDSETVKSVIQTNIDSLKQSLNQSGIQLSSFNISLNNQDQKSNKAFANKRKNSSAKNSEKTVKIETRQIVKNLGYNTYEYLI